jgi:hypothetical protein
MAPIGTVITIAKTAVVSMTFPYSIHYSFIVSSTISVLAKSSTTPPRAACTVDLGIHPNAMKALSFVERDEQDVDKKAASNLKTKHINMINTDRPIYDGVTSVNKIDAPIDPNRIAWMHKFQMVASSLSGFSLPHDLKQP